MLDIITILNVFLNALIEFVPRLIGAIVLLLIGWAVGALVGRALKKGLLRYKIDERIFDGTPIIKLSNVFPLIFTWTIYLIFIQSAVQVLGVTALVTVVGAIVAFLPGLIKGIIILIVGYVLGDYVRRQVEDSGILHADIMGRGLFFFVIYVSVALALPLVGIDPTLVNNILLLIVAALSVGLAMAVGLGLKDTVADLVKTYQKKLAK